MYYKGKGEHSVSQLEDLVNHFKLKYEDEQQYGIKLTTAVTALLSCCDFQVDNIEEHLDMDTRISAMLVHKILQDHDAVVDIINYKLYKGDTDETSKMGI